MLDKARVAIRERRYIEPERDNALTYYRSVLAQEPDNGEARQGLARVGAVLDERLKSAMSERRLDEVARTVAQLKLIRPGDPTLKTHENWLADAQVTSALQANDADRAAALLRQSAQNGSLPADRVAQFQADIDRRRAGARAASLEDLVAARIRDGRLVDPANDSAKYYYSQLRKLSDDPRQTASVQRDLQAAYLQKLRTASAQKKAAEVDRWIAEARAIGASTASIAAAQREPGSPAKTAASEAERLTRLVQERVRDGRLLDPPQDSALFQLSALRAVDPAAATAAASGISTALLASGRGALASGKLDDAQRFATAVRQLGVSGGDIDALDADIKTAQAQIAAAPVQVTASQLKRTRFVAPDYPPKALAKQIEGQVKLRYTIGKDGRVKDPVVVESNPAGVFEEAAITAVQRWRYKPYEVDGNIVEATLATVLTFRPDAGSSH
jgi:TonB family protein